MQSALDRMVRILAASIGVGSVLFTLLGLPAILAQHAILNPVYSVVAAVFFCGLPPIIGVLSLRVPIRTLRLLAAIHAAGTLVLVALWVPAMTDPDGLSGGALPWIIATITVAAVEAAMAVPFLFAWSYMLLIAGASGIVRFITFKSPDASQAIQDAIYVVLISGFLMALVQLTLLAGREQDAAATAARELATATAAAETLERQRTRFNALTRDDVIQTLRAAMQNTREYREYAGGNAVRTLQKMDAYRVDAPIAATVPVVDLDLQLRTAAVAHGVSYASSLGSGDLPLVLPLDVADALSEAMTEAMRNSNRHADRRDGRGVRRTVRVERQVGGVQVIVRDDGRGFNPARIALDRLGVRLSILERVNALPGATATIVSARGRGTAVTLEWTDPTGAES